MKTLMIGNSFSICVLKYMPSVAAELGCDLDLASLFIGGCPLQRHAANIAASEYPDFRPYLVTWNYASLEDQSAAPFASLLGGEKNDHANIPPILAADKWDVVTIQQASHESWSWDTYYPWANMVIAAIRKYAPQARIVVQQTWSYCNADARICNQETKGAGTWGFDQTGMYERLTVNYGRLAAENGFDIIPTGKAVQLYRERLPVTEVAEDVVGNFFTDENGVAQADTIHLNRDGEYLQACVWTAKLFKADVMKLASVPETLKTPARATLLRACARAAAAQGI
jgi:hypothetical protein